MFQEGGNRGGNIKTSAQQTLSLKNTQPRDYVIYLPSSLPEKEIQFSAPRIYETMPWTGYKE